MRKGESYSQIPVDLARWLKDFSYESGLRKIEIAQRMIDPEVNQSINRARLTEMEQGCLNTMKFLQIIVNSFYGGNFERMLKYATNEEGVRMLKLMNFKKKLSAYDLANFNEIIDELIVLFDKKKDSEKIRKLLMNCILKSKDNED